MKKIILFLIAQTFIFSAITQEIKTLPDKSQTILKITKTKGDPGILNSLIEADRAIESNSNSYKAYYNRGILKNNAKDYEGAIEDFTKSISLFANYSNSYYNRGNCYVDIMEYESAIKDFTKTIELDQEDSDAFFNRGFAKYNLKQISEAILDYNKGILLNPENCNAFYIRGV